MKKLNEGDEFDGQIEFSTNRNASIKINGSEIFISKKKTANSLHMDIVRVEIFKGDKKLEGRVIKVLSRSKSEFVGTAQVKRDTTFVVCDNRRISSDFYIKGKTDVKDGQKVVVELIDWDISAKSPRGKITKILGDVGDNNAEMNAIMYEYGLPVEFPQEVINESELIPEIITEKEIEKRRDMRHVTTIGIDPFDSKDADDTISLEVINGLRYVSINIADVTHYIKQGSELEKEAYKRGTSVYLVDRCVPMLPERLSNGICSLKSGRDRLCFTVTLQIDDNGRVFKKWFGRTIINVNKDYSYEQAQEVIDNGVTEENKITDLAILDLDQIARKMRKVRVSDGSLEMGGKEVKFILDSDNKKPIGIYFKEQREANKLIEEYMLLANKEVSRFIKSKELPCVNRIHATPDDEKLINIKKFVDTLGYEFDISDPETTKMEINKLLMKIKGTPEENIISTLIIRSQKKAAYSTEDIGHYGLGFDDYSHFTSPIRRYSDMLIHRLLAIALGNDGYPKIK